MSKKKLEIETYYSLMAIILIVSSMFYFAPAETTFDSPQIWDDDYGDKWQCVYCGALNGSGAKIRPRTCNNCGMKQ
jgi:Zn ribbon nucleic-acid-binding protein